MSAHTLRSLQLSAKTPDPDSIATKSGGTSTPEYVKRTARLFESTDSTALGSQSPKSSVLRSNGRHVGSSKTSDIRSVVVVNGTNSVKTGENLLNADGFTGKKPSYLGLSCSISGYSGITTYDSKLREGFLSRDHSPGRFGIQKSRDVSPLRQGANQFENHLISAYKSDCGNFLVAPPMKAGVVGSGDKVDSASSLKSRPNIVEGDTPGSKNIRTTSGGNQIDVVKDVNGFDQLGRENSKVQSSQSQRMMGDGGKFSVTVQHTVNGVADKLGITSDDWDHRPEQSSHLGNCSSSSTEQFFSDPKSNIRESTRNFMSSMLNTESSFSSAYCETSVTETTKSREVTEFSSTVKNSSLTSVPRDGFRAFSPVRWSPESPKTALRDFPDSCVTSSPRDSSSLSSPLKRSPDSPKTSKDSLSAPAATSSQKRSPGAVRVVEFTSQTKSYVRTAFVSSNSVELTSAATTQGYSDSSQLRSCVDGSQTTSYVKSICSGLTACGSIDSQGPSNTLAAQSKRPELETTAWTSKSFIQQRVERLYGPGALAQGFFRRTRHKPADEVQGPSESCTPHNGHRNNSSPALPVLRHLRPEFRAQLSLGSAAKKLHEHSAGTSPVEDTRASVSKRSATKVIPLQQQISVESLAESLTDLQPAAPDVVLPIEQSQSVSSQPCEQSEESVDPVTETHKDGHYFLKLLKQETERLNELVEVAEADLAKGELLPEDALGKLRAASGQARLLIRQKLQQFEGLCHKNIAQNSEEPFPTTSEDLAGFWDMVMLQVEHVNRLFEEITTLRAANWVEAQVLGKDVADSAPKRRVGGGTRRSSAAPTKSSASSEATRKAREEGRRKMMEERRKAMREKRDTAATSGQVEIFVPQENGN